MKDFLTKMYDFAVIIIAVLAAIGGTAYLFYDGHILFGITSLCLVAMAVPFIATRVKDIIS